MVDQRAISIPREAGTARSGSMTAALMRSILAPQLIKVLSPQALQPVAQSPAASLAAPLRATCGTHRACCPARPPDPRARESGYPPHGRWCRTPHRSASVIGCASMRASRNARLLCADDVGVGEAALCRRIDSTPGLALAGRRVEVSARTEIDHVRPRLVARFSQRGADSVGKVIGEHHVVLEHKAALPVTLDDPPQHDHVLERARLLPAIEFVAREPASSISSVISSASNSWMNSPRRSKRASCASTCRRRSTKRLDVDDEDRVQAERVHRFGRRLAIWLLTHLRGTRPSR